MDKKDIIDSVLATLNSAFACDPSAIHALICNRVPCNAGLADHPTVVVDDAKIIGRDDLFTVGMLGVINGIVEPIADCRVAVQFSDSQDESGKRTIIGFVPYQIP